MVNDNMETKVLEIRDEATHIPALAIRMAYGVNPIRRYYFRRCGYPPDGSAICVMKLSSQEATVDPYGWKGGARTMPVAHEFIYANWDNLEDGDVVDVRHILGETGAPAISERLEHPL